MLGTEGQLNLLSDDDEWEKFQDISTFLLYYELWRWMREIPGHFDLLLYYELWRWMREIPGHFDLSTVLWTEKMQLLTF